MRAGFRVGAGTLSLLAEEWRVVAGGAAEIRDRVTAIAQDSVLGASRALAPASGARMAELLGTAERRAAALTTVVDGDLARLRRTEQTYADAEDSVRRNLTRLAGEPNYATPQGGAATGGADGASSPFNSWHQEQEVQSTQVNGQDRPDNGGRDPSTPASKPSPRPGVSPDRALILRRAEHWIAEQVGYSMTDSYEGYRSDCSGFVSMAWGLPESLTTVTLPGVAHRISAEELLPGDVLLNTAPGADGHVVLFDHWADPAHTSYVGYEESPGGAKHLLIPYPYFPGDGDFEPYRLNNLD